MKYGSEHQRRPWALYLPADQICEPCTKRCGRLSKVSRASWRYKGRLLRRVGEGRLSRYRYKSLIKAQPRSHSLYLHKVMALHVRQNNHLQPLLLPTSNKVSYILLIHTMQCLKTISNTKDQTFLYMHCENVSMTNAKVNENDPQRLRKVSNQMNTNPR